MNKINVLSIMALIALLLVGHFPSAQAADGEPVLLSIQINETAETAPKTLELTITDLTSLPIHQFSTHTNWTDGVQNFTGVALNTLLESIGVDTGEVEMIALNDYSIILQVDDPTNAGAMIAYLQNGAPMTPRGKGPLWLVYDFDSEARFRTETIFSRSIWQLDRMIISR